MWERHAPPPFAIGQPVGKPIFFVRHYLAVRKDDPVAIASTADLARLGDLVTTQRASVFTERLREAGVRVDDATDDNRVNVRKILAGHGRFAYVIALRYLIRKEGLEDRVRMLPVILGDEPMYFRVGHKADPALAPLLGTALDRLKASGELDRIYARWADLAPLTGRQAAVSSLRQTGQHSTAVCGPCPPCGIRASSAGISTRL